MCGGRRPFSGRSAGPQRFADPRAPAPSWRYRKHELAIGLIKHRLQTAFGKNIKVPTAIGEPTTVEDAKKLSEEDTFQFECWALGLVGARTTEKKKGADRGVDGRLYFHEKPAGGDTKLIVLSVKSGKLKAPYVRDLRGVIEREDAAIGVLISLETPTKQMKKEAAAAGFFESLDGKKYPRLQLLTVGDLLDGDQLKCPPYLTNVTFKHAPKASPKKQDRQKNLFEGE